MSSVDVFTARDLRQRAGELLRNAESGRLAVITKHGRPAILAVPFDQRVLEHGVDCAVALHLFEAGQITLARASKLAGMAVEDFIGLLGETGIPTVGYSPEDVSEELEAAQ